MNDEMPLIPTRTRRLVSIRAGGCCEICGRRAALDFHRTTHEQLGHERPDDVLALCETCHEAAHVDPAGEVWDNPDDMAAHWEAFHHAMEKDD